MDRNLLSRVRWGNVALALSTLAVLAILLGSPMLGATEPELPADAPTPVLGGREPIVERPRRERPTGARPRAAKRRAVRRRHVERRARRPRPRRHTRRPRAPETPPTAHRPAPAPPPPATPPEFGFEL